MIKSYEKKNIKIKFSQQIKNYYFNKTKYFSLQSIEQFFNYFLPLERYNYIIIDDDNERSDLMIYDIQSDFNTLFKNDTINILVCIENCLKWNHYNHYNLYGDYGNKFIDIYIYNHKTNLYKTDHFISIPTIYNFINYFKNNYQNIKPTQFTSYKSKKFCLIINKSGLNNDILHFQERLKKIDLVDNIHLYNDEISNKSCYHSLELLNVFHKYKFILCIENSYSDGYITEKIFNCFYARTIPLYKGSPIIKKYLNELSFIDLNDEERSFKTIEMLNNNEKYYNKIIEHCKISNSYDDENYKEELYNFISNKLNH